MKQAGSAVSLISTASPAALNMREAKHFFVSKRRKFVVYSLFSKGRELRFHFHQVASSIRVEWKREKFQTGNQKKKQINNGIRTIMYSLNTQVIVSVRMKIPKISGEGGGGGLFTKHKILRTRAIYDFVGVTRTRVRRIEYRLKIVGIRRTRKRGYKLMKFHT